MDSCHDKYEIGRAPSCRARGIRPVQEPSFSNAASSLARIYTGSSMQIPWYISVPLVIVFAFGALFVVASRAPYYPLKYPGGFWELQSELGAKDVWLRASDRVR